MADYQCKICANTQGNQVVVAREMQFGMRDEFTYFKCSCCGCLQIAETPKDLSKYYPATEYYSFKTVALSNRMLRFVRRVLIDAYLYLNILFYARYVKWLKVLKLGKVKKTDAILDVGCGNGARLQKISEWGFKNLTGIDPFIEKDILYPSGVRVWKTDIYSYPPPHQFVDNQQVTNVFDIIMLHHSFEHMDEPHKVFAQLYKLLAEDGRLLIRIPVSDSFAYRKYEVNWAALDAPRHLFLHTVRSISLLAKKHGFVLEDVIYDSGKNAFIKSEKYCRDIPLSMSMKVSASYIRTCKKMANQFNKMRDGDQACFILQKQKK
ncbi:putative methyltransferase [Bacteroidia bacterium]|nr:putative methyltransferase [Bacteroidia bacterium]GHT80060.1 putative methyltransferase [Bacteroidia bacterium]